MKKTMIAVALVISAPTAGRADPSMCLQILGQNGPFKTVVQQGQTRTFQTAKDWFCSNDFMASASSASTGGSITVPIAGVPVGAAFNTSDASQMQARQSFCQDSSKTFSQVQSAYLALREGDQTLVNAYQSCLDHEASGQPFVVARACAHADGTFDLNVMSRYFPGSQPLMASTTVLGGASPVSVDDLRPGIPVPFQAPGATPLQGTFKFNAASARVRVRTTAGAVTVETAPVAQGSLGTWKVTQEVAHQTQTPMPDFSDDRPVPRAGCDPHCRPADGDWYSYDFTVPQDQVLSNPRSNCFGGPCELNETPAPTLVDPHHIKATIKSRTAATRIHVTATRVQIGSTTSRDTVGNGAIAAGQAFSITLANDTNAEAQLEITSPTFGTVTLTKPQLDANSLPRWLTLQGTPQLQGSNTVYTLAPSVHSCS